MRARHFFLSLAALVAGTACASAAHGRAVSSSDAVDEPTATAFWTAFDAWAVKTNNPSPTYEEWEKVMLQSKAGQGAMDSRADAEWMVKDADADDAVTRMLDLVNAHARTHKDEGKPDFASRLAAFWKGCGKKRKDCRPGDTYIYGVADNNQIYEVNTNRQTARSVLDVSAYIGSNPNGTFNSFAFDAAHDTFYFMNSDFDIQAWVRSSGAVGLVAPKQSVGRANPANAAYYGGAYWFIETTNRNETSVTLARVAFTPPATAGGLPTLAGKTTYNVSLTTTGGAPFTIRNGYGDIAVSAAGDLYIAPVVLNVNQLDSGSLLVLKNLDGLPAGGGSATAVTVAQAGLPGPQLSFDCDGQTLWGQTYVGCEWSTIDTATGALTPRFSLSLPGAPVSTNCLRDLGGAACTCAP